MKQRKPLVRRTGLKTNTQLRAAKPMKRSDAAVPGKSSVNPRKSKKNTDPTKATKDLVKARSSGQCEIQLPELCTQTASDIHHRSGRGMGGTSRPEINTASNLLHACRACHHAVTDTAGKRPEYERAGWIVPRNAGLAAVPVPVLYRGHMVLLDNEGGVTPSSNLGKAA